MNEWFGAIVHGYLVCLSFERPNADTVYCCHNVTILNMQKGKGGMNFELKHSSLMLCKSNDDIKIVGSLSLEVGVRIVT